MENLPAVGWSDVSTRQDPVDFKTRLDLLEAHLTAVIDRGFRHLRRMLSLVIVVGFLVMISTNVAATLLR